MDDLLDLDFNAKSSSSQPLPKPSSTIQSTSYRPSPFQPTLTPQTLSRPSSTLNPSRPTAKSVSPANDSFANLVSVNNAKSPSNLTLQDRQKQLLQERQRQIDEQRKRQQDEAQLWDSLGSGHNTGSDGPRAGIAHAKDGIPSHDDDLLAAFSANAKVDRSSHFPPPAASSASASRRGTPAIGMGNGFATSTVSSSKAFMEDDDDPFGLRSMPQRPSAQNPQQSDQDDDDILGDLGRPVVPRTESKAMQKNSPSPVPSPIATAKPSSDPLDLTMAELVDMGFPADKAKQALIETNCNLQAAVSWLLNQAHEESRQRVRESERPSRTQSPLENGTRTDSRRRPLPPTDGSVPAWLRQETRSGSAQRDQSTSSADKDVSQFAQEIGSSLFKSAGSLWKQGQKRMQKAVTELQQERDPSQPRWMSPDPQAVPETRRPQQAQREPTRTTAVKDTNNMTDEALLLEAGSARPVKPSRSSQLESSRTRDEDLPSRGRSPAQPLPEGQSSRQMSSQALPPQARAPQSSKLSRQAVEDEAAQAYVSSSRRRRPPPQSAPAPEVDLFSAPPKPMISAKPRSRPSQSFNDTSVPMRTKASTPAPTPRPKAVARTVPSVSPSALATSAQQRKAGTEAYKRGDYAAAHEAYTAALTPLPATHPIMIIILSNRALTALKTGDPKMAVTDAERALSLIGPSKGEDETISLDPSEQAKDMKEFYGKALMRKAEALEHMEKWTDAGRAWREAVEANVGGLVAIRGRDRCEKAAKTTAAVPKPATKPAAANRATPTPRKTTVARPTAPSAINTAASAEAVRKLRAQNLAADKADDEKFALSDSVSARIESWKGGKSDNLRALLQSLDNVLWPEANWKKVGMSELVVVSKVKIVYMRAIGKVHPDKIPQDATTEQRMISASVFSTLNEAWDKFKNDNGL